MNFSKDSFFETFDLCFASRWSRDSEKESQLRRKASRLDTQQAREISNSEERLYDWHKRAGTILFARSIWSSRRRFPNRAKWQITIYVFTCHINSLASKYNGTWKRFKGLGHFYPKISTSKIISKKAKYIIFYLELKPN